MNSPNSSGLLTAILPCNDLDASERFDNRLGFARADSQRPAPREPDTYRMLSNGEGGYLHLTDAVEGWLVPGKNPFGLYLYFEDVDVVAREFQKSPEDKPWGMYEFAKSDPDETLVRANSPAPTTLRHTSSPSHRIRRRNIRSKQICSIRSFPSSGVEKEQMSASKKLRP